jgi:phospholipase C
MRTITKTFAVSALVWSCVMPFKAFAATATKTPIHHLILIVGENHSFDNLLATYRPSNGQHVANLLSNGIIDLNGAPGPNASQAQQWQAIDKDQYSITPTRTNPFPLLPQPNTTYAFAANRASLTRDSQPTAQCALPAQPLHRLPELVYRDPFIVSFKWVQFDNGRNDSSQGRRHRRIRQRRQAPARTFTDQSTSRGGVSMGFIT